jgi:hypothetical protein
VKAELVEGLGFLATAKRNAVKRIPFFHAMKDGRCWQIGLSADQVGRLCSVEACMIERDEAEVGEATGLVIDWGSRGGCGGLHVHWTCPLCGAEHISDSHPHADSNPVLWFCERGRGMCLVHWDHERPAG